jgi:oxygen-independent coproporphyrinogen III oxidase
MKLAARYSSIATCVQHLFEEIDLIADALPARMPVSHLHFGSGTSTVLEPADLAAVMARLTERFQLLPDAEIAIESDPRTLTDSMIHQIGSLHFNRASFGVQEVGPKVQAAINRIQPPEMVKRATSGLSRCPRAEHQFRSHLWAASSPFQPRTLAREYPTAQSAFHPRGSGLRPGRC